METTHIDYKKLLNNSQYGLAKLMEVPNIEIGEL